MALPFLFEFWAMDHQLPPDGDWRSWVILGGRGAGKTRAGAEWVRAMVEGPRPLDGGRASRVALVAETLDQARDVMIFGDSGIMEFTTKTPQDIISNAQITTHDLDLQDRQISIEVAQISNAYGPGIAAVLEMG